MKRQFLSASLQNRLKTRLLFSLPTLRIPTFASLCACLFSGFLSQLCRLVHEVTEGQTQLSNFHFHPPHTCGVPGGTQLSSFSSVAQSCPTLCNPMNHSTPGLPVHHQLPEFTQAHIHRVSDAIQPSHPLSSPSPAPNPSQHQSLF